MFTMLSLLPFCHVGVTLFANFSRATSRTLFWPRLSSPVSGRPVLTAQPPQRRREAEGSSAATGQAGRHQLRGHALGGKVAPVEKDRRATGATVRRDAATSMDICLRRAHGDM